MRDLVNRYQVTLRPPSMKFVPKDGRQIAMTGATGLLGAHILDILLQDPDVTTVYCLVRAQNPTDAQARVLQSLAARELTAAELLRQDCPRVMCVPTVLHQDGLGVPKEVWDRMAEAVTHIIHAAWPVNFALQLQSFEDQLAGLSNLLQLRNATRGAAARLIFVSSTAAVAAAGSDGQPIAEMLSTNPLDASTLGYSRSKWVAEGICSSSAQATSASSTNAAAITGNVSNAVTEESPITVVRVGQLCGNAHGIWNLTEAYPLMLSSAKITNCLPLLHDPICWLPVDKAAQAVLDLAMSTDQHTTIDVSISEQPPLYHVLNRHVSVSWPEMMQMIAKESSRGTAQSAREDAPRPIDFVDPSTWLHRLEEALRVTDHPARALLHFWKTAYADDAGHDRLVFATSRAERASRTMRELQPVGEAELLRMWLWITREQT
jgi:thioester reductase-like protein